MLSNLGTYALQVQTEPNATEATKNICCTKGEGTANYITLTRWFKKYHSRLQEPQKSSKVRETENHGFQSHASKT